MRVVLRNPVRWERIKAWGPALRDAARNLWWSAKQNSQDRRLWTGLGISLLLHFLFFFFLPRPGEVEEYELTEVAYFDMSYSPKAAAAIPKTGLFQPAVGEARVEEAIDLTRRLERTQAAIDLERYHPAPEGIAEVIKIGRKGEGGGLTTEEILAQTPVSLRRAAPSGVGGPPGLVGYPGMGVGPPVDLEAGPPLPRVTPQRIRPEERGAPEIAPTPTGPAAQFVITENLRERLIHRLLPRYPNWARERGITNVVITLSLAVTPDGRVNPTSVLVDRSSGYPNWDQDVIEALRGWRFRPLPPEAAQADMWGQVTFIFKLI